MPQSIHRIIEAIRSLETAEERLQGYQALGRKLEAEKARAPSPQAK